MTRIFDSLAASRVLEEEATRPIPNGDEIVANMTVKLVKPAVARGFIAAYHYAKSFPDSTLFVVEGRYGDTLAGYAVFGMGCGMGQYRSICPTIENGSYCELTRLWLHDNAPKNSESKLISLALKLLPNNIKLVVSYADNSQGHSGAIYKATNWLIAGKTNGAKQLVDADGKTYHPRLTAMYAKRHPETYGKMNTKEIIEALGFTQIEGGIKNRFIKFINLPAPVLRKKEEEYKANGSIKTLSKNLI